MTAVIVGLLLEARIGPQKWLFVACVGILLATALVRIVPNPSTAPMTLMTYSPPSRPKGLRERWVFAFQIGAPVWFGGVLREPLGWLKWLLLTLFMALWAFALFANQPLPATPPESSPPSSPR
jgi:hypothetical protein